MEEHFDFDIPERLPGVVGWFSEKLERQLEVEHPGNPSVTLRMETPSTRRLGGPGSNVVVFEIVVMGYRTKGAPIRSDWEPEHLIVGWEDVWEPLGKVMEFQFRAHASKTRVWARCDERFPIVQCIFENFLVQIESSYPAVGSLLQDYRTKYELQQLDLIDNYLKMESGDAPAKTQPQSIDGSATTETEERAVKGPYREQRKKMRQLWEDRDSDIREHGSTQPFSNAWHSLGLSFETVKKWIPEPIRSDWQLRTQRFTWEQFSELWPKHLQCDYEV